MSDEIKAKLAQLDQDYANACAIAGDIRTKIRAFEVDLSQADAKIDGLIREKALLIVNMEKPDETVQK